MKQKISSHTTPFLYFYLKTYFIKCTKTEHWTVLIKRTEWKLQILGSWVWMIVKTKLNAEHYKINTSARISQYHIFQQSNFFEHKLLPTAVEQIFNTSFDFQMPVVSFRRSDCYFLWYWVRQYKKETRRVFEQMNTRQTLLAFS
jgi:hypothetical protein